MRVLRAVLLLLLLRVALPFAILFYFAKFSLGQSIALTLIIVWLDWVMESTARKPKSRFRPYSVAIAPKWYEILKDFKLIGEPKEWHAILEKLRTLPLTEYRVLRDGVLFSVVHEYENTDEFPGVDRALVFLGYHHDFATEITQEESMDPLKIDNQSRSDLDLGDDRFFAHESNRYYVPQFFVKNGLPSGGGSKLGIIVPDWWWERKKAICPGAVSEDTNQLTGEVELVLAEIPPSEFDEYLQLVWWGNPFRRPPTSSGARDEERAKLGWEKFKRPYNPDVRIDPRAAIEHKYFTVEHHAI